MCAPAFVCVSVLWDRTRPFLTPTFTPTGFYSYLLYFHQSARTYWKQRTLFTRFYSIFTTV